MKNIKILFCLLLSVSLIRASAQQVRSIQSIGNGEITVMEIGALGDLWVGTQNGVLHYSSSNAFQGQYDSGVSVNAIALGTVSGNQYAFIGTPMGLSYVENGLTHSVSNALLPSPNISALGFTLTKQLYVFTPGPGAVVLDSTLASLGNPPLPFANVNCAFSTGCAGLIAGTPDSGAFYTTDYVHDTLLQTLNIVSDSVTAVYIPNNCAARVVGTRNGFSFCPVGHGCQNFTTASTHDSLPQNYITSISQDCHGYIWLGMRDSGAVVFMPPTQTFERVNLPDSLGQVTAIVNNPDTCMGANYIGTANGNVARIDSSLAVAHIFTGIQNADKTALGVWLSPQPAANQVNFLFENEVKIGQLCVSDINGRILGYYNLKNTHNFTLDVSNLSAGLYLYRILVDGELAKAGKVEVMR